MICAFHMKHIFLKGDSFRRLLETYNNRVDTAETDKSMSVEIPRNL
jgi:hypothetical protein